MLSESIDLLHTPHNAPVPYPTMQQFITVAKSCIVGYFSDALRNLLNGSINS